MSTWDILIPDEIERHLTAGSIWGTVPLEAVALHLLAIGRIVALTPRKSKLAAIDTCDCPPEALAR